ncbi:uncharacterized protein LOC105695859 isoform X2 [Orussus abietinus]|uniref:uncharacterized protein LOC105695859 isoform X2 n=1 Tax=Orussus abietinus TaxID=222816 RepID=UPI000C715ACB|nr:uncharacterized protein LOC105695859 isoform X2 [Orussus abietinus]
MKCVTLMLVSLLVGIECRLLVPSSMDDANRYWNPKILLGVKDIFSSLTESSDSFIPISLADPEVTVSDKKSQDELKSFILSQGRKLEKLLLEFLDKTDSPRDYVRASQWVNQLWVILKELSNTIRIKSKRPDLRINEVADMHDKSETMNSLDDLLDSVDKRDIYYQDNQDEKHVKSRSDDSSASTILSHGKHGDEEDAKATKNGAEHLDEMLVEVQNQLGLIRKYYGKLCRHHALLASSSLSSRSQDSSSVNQPKKISIL